MIAQDLAIREPVKLFLCADVPWAFTALLYCGKPHACTFAVPPAGFPEPHLIKTSRDLIQWVAWYEDLRRGTAMSNTRQ
jgi:hypothetical protein